MNKILVVMALLITVSIASVVNANEQQYGNGNNVPLTHNDYVIYSRGSCYPDSGCWTEERVTVTNTDNVGGYFSVSYGSFCDACKTESEYISAGGNYMFNIGIFANGNNPIQYKVNAPMKSSQISNPNSWVPVESESCWSSGTNIGRCTGRAAGGFLKGFFSELWHS